MGLGLLGGALNDVKFLLHCGADLVITDIKSSSELKPSLKKLEKFKGGRYVLHLGGHKIEDFRKADFVLQPGNVPLDSPYLAEARKNKIPIYESESLFMKYAKAMTIIGVTGTRGKTTVTYLIYEILKSAFGKKVFLGGNIQGASTLSLLKKIQPGDIAVLELDSWCLHGLGDIKKSPQIAVFTNFLSDHLNFYLKGLPTKLEAKEREKLALQKYFNDKAQIFASQTAGDYLILDEEIKKIIAQRYQREIKSKIILIKDASEIKKWKLKITGEHNFRHILRAIEVAKILGVDKKTIKKAVENFGGVAGRQEFIREYKGIKIYNDTTATTPDATLVALKSLGKSSSTTLGIKSKKIVLILGGADKNLDMSVLVREVPKYCKQVILLAGTGSEKLHIPSFVKADTLPAALSQALSFCQKGDILLFSPAFASFGMFKNEYDRGNRFNKLVKALK